MADLRLPLAVLVFLSLPSLARGQDPVPNLFRCVGDGGQVFQFQMTQASQCRLALSSPWNRREEIVEKSVPFFEAVVEEESSGMPVKADVYPLKTMSKELIFHSADGSFFLMIDSSKMERTESGFRYRETQLGLGSDSTLMVDCDFSSDPLAWI